jgi:hypothetical protein
MGKWRSLVVLCAYGLVAGVAAGDEPAVTEYRALAERRVWVAELTEESEGWYLDKEWSRSTARSSLVLATDPRLGTPARVGVLLASAKGEVGGQAQG